MSGPQRDLGLPRPTASAPVLRGGARPRAEETRRQKRSEEKRNPSNPPSSPARHDARDRLAGPPRRRAPPHAAVAGPLRRTPPAAAPGTSRMAARGGVGGCAGGRPAREGGGGGAGVPGDDVRDAAAVLHARGKGWGREDELRGVAGRALRQQRPPHPRRLHRPRALAERLLRAGCSPRRTTLL